MTTMITRQSLADTVHAVNDAFYSQQAIPAAKRLEIAQFIADRQGLAGAYASSFAGFSSEANEIRLYTGEQTTCASARHILGEECCRALRLLKVRNRDVRAALNRADAGLADAIERAAQDPRNEPKGPGWFCCGKCSVAFWRNLLSGGLDRQEERLAKGVRYLKTYRDGAGKWRRFPFWYTVLALSDMDTREARAELRYAQATIERTAKRDINKARDNGTARRIALAQRCLSS